MSGFFLKGPSMRKNMSILRFRLIPEKPDILKNSSSARRQGCVTLRKFIAETIACVFCFTVVSVTGSDFQGRDIPEVKLLREFRAIGGFRNNLHDPDLNAVPGSPEIALAPLNFALERNDGLVDGPNPRIISRIISGGTGANGQSAQTTDPVASAWLYVFGQFVDHDLDLEETLTTSAPIDIVVPPGDPVFPAGTSIHMTRDTRNPATNTITNTVAGYLDLSQLYGSTPEVAASLCNNDGILLTSDNGLALPVVNDSFVTGDPRAMENPELTAVTILFMREHNFWVNTLKAQHPNWTGDQLYNMARAITTAEYQNIIYEEFLPILIGRVLGPYSGYNPAVTPR
jgi:peroxidase